MAPRRVTLDEHRRRAVLQMTTQAFEKIHRMDDGASASRHTRLAVEAGAYLDYKPLPQDVLDGVRALIASHAVDD